MILCENFLGDWGGHCILKKPRALFRWSSGSPGKGRLLVAHFPVTRRGTSISVVALGLYREF